MSQSRSGKTDPFLRYHYYERAVQSPYTAIELANRAYRNANKRRAYSLREDFSGSAWLACEWVRQSPRHTALAVDLDPEPIQFGREFVYSELTAKQQKRMSYIQKDVRKAGKERFDVIVALNFSYCEFKTRRELLGYFKSVRRSLKRGGVFMIDVFGGERSQVERNRKTQYGDLSYFWHCKSFNPVHNEAYYAIHFKKRGQKAMRNAFDYHWRLWSCPELREVMHDAGFKYSTAYWEGDNGKGGGDGKFTATEWEENSLIWQSFIVGGV